MAAENSFDIACKVDMQEVANAVSQARREVETRHDLQAVIALVKAKDPGVALQFTNYRSTWRRS